MDNIGSSVSNEIIRRLKRSKLDFFSVVLIIDNLLYFMHLNNLKLPDANNYFVKYAIGILNLLYSDKFVAVFSTALFILIIIICILGEKHINLPEEKTFTDGKIVGYSYITASINISHIIYYYVYSMHVVYLTMLLVNKNNIINGASPSILHLFIIADEFILVIKVFKAIFQYDYFKDFDREIDSKYFDTKYNVISETIIKDGKLMILKDSVRENHPFYVVRQDNVRTSAFSRKPIYTILNSSLNFDDVKFSYMFHVDELKKKTTNN